MSVNKSILSQSLWLTSQTQTGTPCLHFKCAQPKFNTVNTPAGSSSCYSMHAAADCTRSHRTLEKQHMRHRAHRPGHLCHTSPQLAVTPSEGVTNWCCHSCLLSTFPPGRPPTHTRSNPSLGTLYVCMCSQQAFIAHIVHQLLHELTINPELTAQLACHTADSA